MILALRLIITVHSPREMAFDEATRIQTKDEIVAAVSKTLCFAVPAAWTWRVEEQ